MTTEIAEPKQDSVYWIGHYQKKNEDELQGSKYCVVDGWCWTTGPGGSVFCAGPVEKIKNQLAGGSTDAPETNPPLSKNSVTKLSEGESTTLKDGESKTRSFVTPQKPVQKLKDGRPQKEIPVGIIVRFSTQGLGTRQIATKVRQETGIPVSHMTVQRILSGQRALV